MSHAIDAMREIISFIDNAIKRLERAQLEGLCDLLIDAYKARRSVLVMGAGRSGLVGRAFAMRLRHLGFESYVLGETITPALKENDLVLAISGSGSTELIVTAATAAKKVGAKVVAITSHPNSPLGRIADLIVEVPGRTKISGESNYFARQILGIHEPLAPLGTLFEDTTMIVLDGLIVELMQRLGKKEDELRIMHANIEL